MIPLRMCNKCGLTANNEEELKNFVKDSRRPYGRGSQCLSCKNAIRNKKVLEDNEYYKKEYKKNKEKRKQRAKLNKKSRREEVRKKKLWAISYKGSKCEHCGIEHKPGNECIFEFHHINPSEKEVNPSQAINCSKDRAKKELDKCSLLCSNCHKLEHSRLRSLDEK